jgi:transposase-like protein
VRERASLYRGHRFPAEVIAPAVRLYLRFALSYRDVEELLAERGVQVSYETVRRWVAKFGPFYADELRRREACPGRTWHLDERAVRLRGQLHWLWRAVDEHGTTPDVLLHEHRDDAAAERLFRRLLVVTDGAPPARIATDKLGSDAAALRRVLALRGAEHLQVRPAVGATIAWSRRTSRRGFARVSCGVSSPPYPCNDSWMPSAACATCSARGVTSSPPRRTARRCASASRGGAQWPGWSRADPTDGCVLSTAAPANRPAGVNVTTPHAGSRRERAHGCADRGLHVGLWRRRWRKGLSPRSRRVLRAQLTLRLHMAIESCGVVPQRPEAEREPSMAATHRSRRDEELFGRFRYLPHPPSGDA